MKLLPVALEIENRPVLIVGGGAVAARKALSFLECGAKVTVISPQLIPDFPAVEHRIGFYKTGDLEDFSLVCACTDERKINAQIAQEAKRLGIWCNIADDPQNSDFHTTSVVRRAEIAVGISTGGVSPVLARFVRGKIEAALPTELETLLKMASSYDIPTEIRGDFWRQILKNDVLPLFRAENLEAAQALFEQVLEVTKRA